MSCKSLTLNAIWIFICFILIVLFSTKDKEWFIDGNAINNICDVMEYIENDDIRSVGIVFTLPLFVPFIYTITWKKQRNIWQYSAMMIVLSFWLWRFIFRYQFCS
jgi:cbb3-type cytochrome oxidase subunit 3